MSQYTKSILTLDTEFMRLGEEFILPLISDELIDIHDSKEQYMLDLIDKGGLKESVRNYAQIVFPNAKK